MIKFKVRTKYELDWVDTIGYEGWHYENEIEDMVNGYMIKTSGYFVKQMKLFIVIAQSYQTQTKQYGNVVYIPIGTIIKAKEIK